MPLAQLLGYVRAHASPATYEIGLPGEKVRTEPPGIDTVLTGSVLDAIPFAFGKVKSLFFLPVRVAETAVRSVEGGAQALENTAKAVEGTARAVEGTTKAVAGTAKAVFGTVSAIRRMASLGRSKAPEVKGSGNEVKTNDWRGTRTRGLLGGFDLAQGRADSGLDPSER